MDINYIRDVKPFDDNPGNGWTDAEIAHELNGQTPGEIGTGSARDYHASVDWWFLADVGQLYEGEFQVVRDAGGTPAGIKSVLKTVWAILFGVGQSSMNTTLRYSPSGKVTKKQLAGDLQQMLDWMVTNVTEVTQNQVDEFYILGGGLKYPASDVTAADVTVSRAEYNESTEVAEQKTLLGAEYDRQYNLNIAPIQESNNPADVTNQAYKDALNKMAADWVDV